MNLETQPFRFPIEPKLEMILKTELTEVGEWPLFDYGKSFEEGQPILFEVVTSLDDERTIAVIIPVTPQLSRQLRTLLES